MLFSFIFVAALLLSAFFIRFTIPIALNAGLVDHPGGRKKHSAPVPLVGGLCIYLSLCVAWLISPILDIGQIDTMLIAASGLLMIVGLVDDRVHLSVKIRFSAQILAVLVMIQAAGVMLDDFGYLVSDELLVLGAWCIPLTIFATIGTINALNMIDGIDGLAGLVSFVSLALLLMVAFIADDLHQALLIVCLMGAVAGFLLFNMPWFGRRKASVFLGDAGSTLLGFVFAWLFVSMSQGPERAMPPVTALWLFAVPLIDTVSVMLRRIWMGDSPFNPDRSHLHHLLLDAGFRVRQAVFTVAGLQFFLGALGLLALYAGVPEPMMFYGFLGLFALYLNKLCCPSRSVPRLRRLHGQMRLIVAGVTEVYVGRLEAGTAVADIERLLGEQRMQYRLELFGSKDNPSGENYAFAVIDAESPRYVKRLIKELSGRDPTGELDIRQFIHRDPANDRRKKADSIWHDKRSRDRRSNLLQPISHMTTA